MRGARWLTFAICASAGCGRFSFESMRGDDMPGDGTPGDDEPGGDGGDANANGDAGDVACPMPSIVCEGFETLAAPWQEMAYPVGADALETTLIAHHGTDALEAVVPVSASNGRASWYYDLPAAPQPDVLSARLWVYPIDPLLMYDHVLLLADESQFDTFVAIGADEFGNWTMTEGYQGSYADRTTATPNAEDVWTCVEVVVDKAAGRVQFYVNETLLRDEPLQNPAPLYRNLHVGLPRGDPGGAHVVVDDLVVRAGRAGCGPS